MTSRQILLLRVLIAAGILLLLAAAWVVTDPTFSTTAKSDSPSGQYRCAVFDKGGSYEFALFEKSWHWRELPGQRGQVSTDSLTLSNIQFVWVGDKVTVTGNAGRDHTVVGQIANGKQVWK